VRRRLDGFELDVAFQADEGRVVLFGPSGAGKSLTLQAITGVMRPDAGRLEVNGRLLFDSASGVNLPPQDRRLGYVPQSYALFPHLTVKENVAYGVQRLDAARRRALVQEMVELVGLQGLERRWPRELSGGQQQRVALARALASRPELLVLDEPFSNIDTGLRGTLRRELLDLQARSGITTLVVTHDLDDAFFLGSRIVVIDRGQVLQAGSREDIFYRPATRRVAEFVGTRNILRATVLESNSQRLVLDWQGRPLEADPISASPAGALPLSQGQEVEICIRPTQVMIVRPDRLPHLPSPENPLCGTVVQEALQAEAYVLRFRLADSPARPARLSGPPVRQAGRQAGGATPYDLEIELPDYVYFRLGLDQKKDATISIHRSAMHVIPVA
jgi:molybdate transport system ATP-binding protein